jgi:aminoglycoside-2''-adenylyltransferase
MMAGAKGWERMGSFEAIEAVGRVMAGFPRPWFVSGGWAIDLFVGRVTREHEDREVGIFRQDQEALRKHLPGRALFKAVTGPDGGAYVPWAEGEWLELPVHQILARPARVPTERGCGAPATEQDRCPEEFEFFLNEAADGVWRCRRNMEITRPVAEISRQSSSGIPYIVPEIQLLYKAKWHREKDEHDFQTALGLLAPQQRAWLKEGLEIIHPGDPWLAAL